MRHDADTQRPEPPIAADERAGPAAEPATYGSAAADPATYQSSAAGAAAGTGTGQALPRVTDWPTGVIAGLQEQWREVQLRFVDDPLAAAEQAQELLDRALEEYTRAVAARKADLDAWRNSDSPDTEQIRLVIQRYRDLLNELLG